LAQIPGRRTRWRETSVARTHHFESSKEITVIGLSFSAVLTGTLPYLLLAPISSSSYPHTASLKGLPVKGQAGVDDSRGFPSLQIGARPCYAHFSSPFPLLWLFTPCIHCLAHTHSTCTRPLAHLRPPLSPSRTFSSFHSLPLIPPHSPLLALSCALLPLPPFPLLSLTTLSAPSHSAPHLLALCLTTRSMSLLLRPTPLSLIGCGHRYSTYVPDHQLERTMSLSSRHASCVSCFSAGGRSRTFAMEICVETRKGVTKLQIIAKDNLGRQRKEP
jgi:hypothetical protein